MDERTLIELARIRLSVEAIRERVSRDLDALRAELDRLIPEEALPDEARVPTVEDLMKIVKAKGGEKE